MDGRRGRPSISAGPRAGDVPDRARHPRARRAPGLATDDREPGGINAAEDEPGRGGVEPAYGRVFPSHFGWTKRPRGLDDLAETARGTDVPGLPPQHVRLSSRTRPVGGAGDRALRR